jgi:hypothetical protein
MPTLGTEFGLRYLASLGPDTVRLGLDRMERAPELADVLFARREVDVAVNETGLGGHVDARLLLVAADRLGTVDHA